MHSLVLLMALLGCPVQPHNEDVTLVSGEQRAQVLDEASYKKLSYTLTTSFVDTKGETIEKTGTLHISQSQAGTVACIEDTFKPCRSLQDYSIFIHVDQLLSVLVFDENVLPFGENATSFQEGQAQRGQTQKRQALFHGLFTIEDNISQQPQDVTVSYHNLISYPISDTNGNDIKTIAVPLSITGTIEQTRLPQKVNFKATLNQLVLQE